jgi:hypothetical protein
MATTGSLGLSEARGWGWGFVCDVYVCMTAVVTVDALSNAVSLFCILSVCFPRHFVGGSGLPLGGHGDP